MLAQLLTFLLTHFEAILFAFCAFAAPSPPPPPQPAAPLRAGARVAGARAPVWRLEAVGFGSLCAACGLLGPNESRAIYAEADSSPLSRAWVEAGVAAGATPDDLGFEVAPLLRSLVRIAAHKAGPARGVSPQARQMRGTAPTAAAAAAAPMVASLETVVGQLARRMSASTRGVAQPLVLARGVRRAVRSVSSRSLFAAHDTALRRVFVLWESPPLEQPAEHVMEQAEDHVRPAADHVVGLERWLAMVTALQGGSTVLWRLSRRPASTK